MVGPVSICGRELLRRWCRPIGLIKSFMIFRASVQNIFGYHKVAFCLTSQNHN
jgi:hypothetical protein